MARSTTDPAASMALLRDLMRDDVGLEYAEAAERRAATGGDEAPTESRTAGRSTLFLLTVVLVAGVLAVGLVQRKADEPASQAAREALVERADAAEARVVALEASVAATRAELTALQDAALADSVEGEVVSERIARLSEVTGYTAVRRRRRGRARSTTRRAPIAPTRPHPAASSTATCRPR